MERSACYSITVRETAGISRQNEPVEVGIPLPRETITAPSAYWEVVDDAGTILPSQWQVLQPSPDGPACGLHGVFLINLDAGAARTVTVRQAPYKPVERLVQKTATGIHVDTGAMTCDINKLGELVSLCCQGQDILAPGSIPSMRLALGISPSDRKYASYTAMSPESQLTVTVKEDGPVRGMVNVSGRLVLADRRGPVVLQVDADYVFYAGRAEIHLSPMLLGAVTDATIITGWSLKWSLANGHCLTYGHTTPVLHSQPNHEHMRWCGLPEGWASWAVNDTTVFTIWSPDFQRHRNGCIETMAEGAAMQSMQVTISRVEPSWGYGDVSQVPTPITINRGGWRRWQAVFALSSVNDDMAVQARRWAHPLRAFPSSEQYRTSLAPWLEGETTANALYAQVVAKCEAFVCHEPEYDGSLYGGWDGTHDTMLERGVARGDFGEYLFRDFFRTGDPRLYAMAYNFGLVYRDIFCFTLPEASDGPHELGGARARQTEHITCPIRSYRGAVLLAYMYGETGDRRYLQASEQRAAYHLANYPHHIGRLSMSTHDSAFLADYLRQPALLDKALECTSHSLDRHFDPVHGFYEGYDEAHPLPDGRYPPVSISDGEWIVGDYLYTSNASPEMTAYNIIGWYGLCRVTDPGTAILEKIATVCRWFRDCQLPDGSWPYPHDTSRTRWGHGCLQDALAMLYAYKLFRDDSFLRAAERSIAFADRLLREHGRIPLILGILPHEETEDSLTYYYGLETLAVYASVRQTVQSITQGCPST